MYSVIEDSVNAPQSPLMRHGPMSQGTPDFGHPDPGHPDPGPLDRGHPRTEGTPMVGEGTPIFYQFSIRSIPF